ncbi:MAG: YdeI/OmpD-associated family protein [Balneolaceae bacterium]
MENPLLKKFQLKEESSVLLMNSNPTVHPLFEGVRIEYSDIQNQDFDSVILFTENEDELRKWVPKATKKHTREKKLWLSYPKKSSHIKTDLNRDKAWKALQGYGFDPVRVISVNEDWSSMRLVKKEDRKKPSTFGQDPPGVDRKTKTVVLPKDMAEILSAQPKAKAFFDELTFSRKREYLGWIHEAKKEETRNRRIQKTVNLLKEGRKSL